MKNLSKNLAISKATASDVVSQEVEILEVNTDAYQYARFGWGIVLFGVLGFLIWASFAPLDRGVPMSGTVMVAGSRKVIQHQNGGTVDEILVKDGDVVKAGQTLLRMNSTQAKAAAEISRGQWLSALASEARLTAERDGAKSVTYPAALLAHKSEPVVASNMILQQQLFSTRRMGVESDLGAAEESIAGLRSQIKGLEESMISKKQQQAIVKEQLESMRELAKEGFIARNRLLEIERAAAQLNGNIAEDLGNIGRTNRQIAELTLRKVQRQQDYQKEIRTQLTDIQKEAESLHNRVEALDYDLRNVEVKAPVGGVVVGLNVFTNGAVVPSGYKLLELVPSGDALIVEGQLPVNLIDKVHQGLKVELIFSAFNSNTTPHIPGVITQISADRSVDERTGAPYYKVKAAVAPEGLKMIANLNIRPGMPVDLFVKTGERTMMNYLLKPVFDRAGSALSEE